MSSFIAPALSIGASLFGGSQAESAAPQIDLNRLFGTGASSLRGGQLTLDPSIRGLQEESLAGIRGLQGLGRGFGDITSRLRGGFQGLREQVAGGRGAFLKARTDPLRETLTRRRGGLQRELGRTGVRGTFGQQALTGLDIAGERELANQRALALAESLGLERQLTLDELSTLAPELQGLVFEAGLVKGIGDIGQQRFTQELAGLGLGVDSINALLGRSIESAPLLDEARKEETGFIGEALGGIGGLFKAGGLFGG